MNRRTRSFLVAALLAPFLACGPKPTNEPFGQGVLVIAIDGLRADHLSAAGYDRPTTPVLDALARQGTLFANAWSPAPSRIPAHAALLTGCDPWIVRRDDPSAPDHGDPFAWRIPETAPHLAQELLAHGWSTAAFVCDPALSPVCGFGAGFQTFLQPDPSAASFDDLADRFRNWLFEKSPSQDWFAYVHVDELVRLWGRARPDPQWDTFFQPRPELASIPPVAEGDEVFNAIARSRWPGGTLTVGEYEARYDGALYALDKKLGQLFERLRRTGRLKNTTVVVCGTFGTSFGESGLYLTSGALSEADLHVPLFVRPPLSSATQRGRRSEALVGLVDVAPTLLELLHVGVPASMHGRSQLTELSSATHAGETPAPRDALFASGGTFAGWAALDGTTIYERSLRGGAGEASTSWSGERARGPASTWESARARDGAVDDARRERLSALGVEWFRERERERRALQSGVLAGPTAGADALLARSGGR